MYLSFCHLDGNQALSETDYFLCFPPLHLFLSFCQLSATLMEIRCCQRVTTITSMKNGSLQIWILENSPISLLSSALRLSLILDPSFWSLILDHQHKDWQPSDLETSPCLCFPQPPAICLSSSSYHQRSHLSSQLDFFPMKSEFQTSPEFSISTPSFKLTMAFPGHQLMYRLCSVGIWQWVGGPHP